MTSQGADLSRHACVDCGTVVGDSPVAYRDELPRYGPLGKSYEVWFVVDSRGFVYHWHDGDECDWVDVEADR